MVQVEPADQHLTPADHQPLDRDPHADRLHEMQSAVAPWWSRSGAACMLLLLLTLGLLGLFLVVTAGAGSSSGSFTLSRAGSITLIGLVVIAVGLIAALVLTLRRKSAGVAVALLLGILLTAVLGWVSTSVVSFSLPNSTGLLVSVAVAAGAAAVSTIVISLTYGRLLRIGRAQDEVGRRTF